MNKKVHWLEWLCGKPRVKCGARVELSPSGNGAKNNDASYWKTNVTCHRCLSIGTKTRDKKEAEID